MSNNNLLHPYNEKQEQFDRRYLEMADIWAKNSYCKRRKVGALIVKDKMIISDGYNGTPSGFENICEDDSDKTNLMFCMLKQMLSQKWQNQIIPAKMPLFMLLPVLVWNVPN